MKKSRFSYLCLLVTFAVTTMYAQTQKGYVKTLGRPDKKGVALSDVTVRVKGGHSPVLSRSDGTFNLVMRDKKNGDAYSLQQVQKLGYELNDMGIIGRQYAFSDKVPLTIVMVSTAQLQADKQRIERNAYKVAEKNYKMRLSQLEKHLSKSTITKERYQVELHDLQDKFEKYQAMIDGLAEHYAHVDYDNLDEKDREINMCIESGELERADSLIHILFNPIDVLKRNKEALSKIEQQVVQAKDVIIQANADMATVLKQQEKDAEHLYQLYTIALAKFENKKARKYIETRAALDTTRIEWQMEAGACLDYLGQYNQSFLYYQRSLAVDLKPLRLSYVCHSRIGGLYVKRGDYTNGIDELEKALQLSHELEDDSLIEQVISLGNIGGAYQEKGDFLSALRMYNKATAMLLDLIKSNQNDSSIFISPKTTRSVWMIYINGAELERKLGKYEDALRLLMELRSMYHLDEVGDNHIYAQVLNNIGMIYYQKGQRDKALEYYQRSLTMYRNIYGKQHPNIALLYNNIGELYRTGLNIKLAQDNHQKAMDMRRLLHGNQHPDVAQSLSNLGLTYNDAKKYNEALPCFEEAIQIYSTMEVVDDDNYATVESNTGMAYYGLNDFQSAYNHFVKAQSILERSHSMNYFLLASVYGNLYGASDKLNKKHFAADNWWKRLTYYGKLIDTNDFYNTDYYQRDCALEYQDLGNYYAEIGDTAQFDVCYLEAKSILSKLPSEENTKFADIFLTKGMEDYTSGNIDGAEKFLKKALNIYVSSYGEDKLDVAACYNALGTICLSKKRYSEGEGYVDKAVSITEKLFPQGHSELYLYYGTQGAFRMRKFEESTRRFAQAKRLEHFGEDECFSKALEMAEKFYPGDTEQIKASVQTLVKLYAIRVSLGENDYKEKMRALAIRHPKQFKNALDNLQQQVNTQQHQMK